jgi:hypothetical protein
VLANHAGRIDSYGVELEVINLARSLENASARITVRDAAGQAVTFQATRAHQASCLPHGTVYWDGPDDRGHAVA